MKKARLIAAVLTGSLIVVGSSAAHAQLLLDQAINGTIGAGTELGAAALPSPTSQTIMKNLQAQGYSDISALSPEPGQDLSAKYAATAPGGIPVTLAIDPKTGKLLGATPR